METKVSKAQLEVWEWKEKLYEELKNIPESKRIGYLIDKVKNTVEKLRKKKGTS
ncbi:MAG TPA: hypothetical protein VI757_05305 [Bacteroidia bacterium]|nr:hypothetical protein [Bacteroidia bacterium]